MRPDQIFNHQSFDIQPACIYYAPHGMHGALLAIMGSHAATQIQNIDTLKGKEKESNESATTK